MNASNLKPIMIDLNLGDQLTFISCGHVVVELIKFIAYQRMQIPFTYPWLKQIVSKKKMGENQEKVNSFQAERHFRTMSTALENLDFIFKSLFQEINDSSIPEEVCIALGGTTVTLQEVYRLLLPTLCHKPQCHSPCIASDQKVQRNVFKALVTSEKLGQIFFSPLPPTNIYVLIKKKKTDKIINSDNFVHYSGCRIPRKSNVIVIDLRTQNKANVACCNKFQVFGDVISDDISNLKLEGSQSDQESTVFTEIESSDIMQWYQSTYVMKGFKDCIVNGTSIMNEWL